MDPVTGIKYSKACDQLGTIREFMAYYLRTFCNLKLSRNVLISSICYFYQWGDIYHSVLLFRFTQYLFLE